MAANTNHHNFTERRWKHQLAVRGAVSGRRTNLKKECDLTGYSASQMVSDEYSDDESLSALREAHKARKKARKMRKAEEEDIARQESIVAWEQHAENEAYDEEEARVERVPFEPP